MKLLVFAHTPPPHHGQSYMVSLMLDGLGGDQRGALPAQGSPRREGNGPSSIQCYHVNARLSKELDDIGDLRAGKLFLLFAYCVQAIWYRFRYGVTNLYYVPAPGKRSAVYRDWLVMLVCRPFFSRVILHWHASGLATWLETSVNMRWRSFTYLLTKQVDLSIVLSNYGRRDAEKLFPKRIAVVPNGIPDPCPDFKAGLLMRRRARLAARRVLAAGQALPVELVEATGPDPQAVKVLFLAHCTRDKGLFDAVQGVLLAQEWLRARGSRISLQLTVAGQFISRREETEFQRLCSTAARQTVTYVGYVTGDQKRRLFEQADLFCFPSYLESFGLVLAEAMAFGLPIVTTRCGAVPEVMAADYPGLVDVRSPRQIAVALLSLTFEESFEMLRRRFEAYFTLPNYLSNLTHNFLSLEPADSCATSLPTTGQFRD